MAARPAGLVLAAIALYAMVTAAQTYPARDAVSVLSDGEASELYIVTVSGRNREITTHQFFESRPDLGEVEFLKRVNWEASIPEGAELFIPTSGRLRDELNAFWIGWHEANSVSALSIFQEQPIRAALEASDALISQPIIMPNKKLYYYFWRGPRLMRLEFSGEFKHAGSVGTVELSTPPGAPVLSASRAVPASTGDESLLGLVEEREDEVEPAVLFVSGKTVKRVSAKPLAGYVALPRQRMGMHVATDGAVSIALVAERRDSKAYVLIEATCDPTAFSCRVATQPLANVGAGTLYSAAPLYYERRTSRELFVLLLDTNGKLSEVRKGVVRPIRSGVDRNYSFPILPTVAARYEARFTDNHSVELGPIH